MIANPPLFHWSPRDRRASIERLGLVPGKRPTCSSSADWGASIPGQDWRPPYICLAPDPDLGAAYSWRIHGTPGETWDLWQVYLNPELDMIGWRRRESEQRRHFENGEWSLRPRRVLIEVRVMNRIHRSRIEWVGERALRDVRGRPR